LCVAPPVSACIFRIFVTSASGAAHNPNWAIEKAVLLSTNQLMVQLASDLFHLPLMQSNDRFNETPIVKRVETLRFSATDPSATSGSMNCVKSGISRNQRCRHNCSKKSQLPSQLHSF
jgi:hypothetical protein